MQSDLKFLLEGKDVHPDDVAKLLGMSITSMGRLAPLEDTRSGAREAFTKHLGLDTDTAAGRGRLIAALDAWETAQKRGEVQRSQDAEAMEESSRVMPGLRGTPASTTVLMFAISSLVNSM